jgi:hypothetical protein
MRLPHIPSTGVNFSLWKGKLAPKWTSTQQAWGVFQYFGGLINSCPAIEGGENNSEILGWYGVNRRTTPKFPDFFLPSRQGDRLLPMYRNALAGLKPFAR